MGNKIHSYFKTATGSILKENGFTQIGLEESATVSAPPCDILAAIGLAGDLKGHFVVSFEASSAKAFVERLSAQLGIEASETLGNSYRNSALAEITNQIGGRTSALLAETGLDCLITPPTVISGLGISTLLPASSQQVRYTVKGDFGAFECVIALK